MKNLFLTMCLICLSITISYAQETEETKEDNQKQENLYIKLKDSPNPDVYIDGEKYNYTIFGLLDQSKIESVTVIKDERAIKEYNAPNGVLIIKTKKNTESNNIEVNTKNKGNEKDPVIFIDGKLADKDNLTKISPDDIEKIDVIKGKEALNKYNAPNGVIIITTKKKKK